MANENNNNPSGNETWLDDVLSKPEVNNELGPDESAVYSAGLTDISDVEFEKIMRETKSEQWMTDEESPIQPDSPASAAEFHDDEYQDAFGDDEALADAFEKPKKEPEPEKPAAPPRKVRPKRKKGYGLLGIPHIIVTAIWLVIIVMIGVWMGRVIWVSAADVLAFGKESQQITLTIEDTDDLEIISQKLKSAGLIEYPGLFKLYGELSHADQKIDPGTYTLDTIYDYMALVNSMQIYSGARQTVSVMIPEGYTCKQIFALLEEKEVCTVEELEEYAANGELDEYWFLEGIERGDKYCLEGFLFPDTYEFYTNDDPERVLEKLLDDFDYRFSESMMEELTTLNERLTQVMLDNGHDEQYISEHLVTIHDLVIIASMIEKETATSLESYTIASVIYNRLYDWGSTPPFLNIDASIIYALDGNVDPVTGKTKPLTMDDLALDHPYNTYVYTGLTPGPISNPGLNSLYAALDPDDTNYFFYVLDPSTNSHHFSATEAEHLAFINTLETEDGE